MIATMKRNRVIRDAWASFFFHPFLLKGTWSAGISRFPQDVAPIRKLIEAAKKYGYEFISLSEWKRKAGKHIRPERYHQIKPFRILSCKDYFSLPF